MKLLPTFPTPYYAVIFSSLRANEDEEYYKTNEMLEKMAANINGFLGIESSREGSYGLGISVSYWKSLDAISEWRKHTHHKMAKEKGIKEWYTSYSFRICKVEQDNLFIKEN